MGQNKDQESLRHRGIHPGEVDLVVPYWCRRILGHRRFALERMESVL